MKSLIVFAIKVYKYSLSGILRLLYGKGCRFTPTCAEYGVEAINKFGVTKGSYITLKRILRCHPFSRGGFDPVKL